MELKLAGMVFSLLLRDSGYAGRYSATVGSVLTLLLRNLYQPDFNVNSKWITDLDQNWSAHHSHSTFDSTAEKSEHEPVPSTENYLLTNSAFSTHLFSPEFVWGSYQTFSERKSSIFVVLDSSMNF